MIIGICGCEGTGKTTLANLLSQKYHLPLVKMKVDEEIFGQIELGSKVFNQTLVQFANDDFILDRFFIDSIVYKEVFNRQVDTSYLQDIIRALQDKLIIIFLYADKNDLVSRRPDDKFIDVEKYMEIQRKYEDVLLNTFGLKYRIIRINTSQLDIDGVYQKAVEELKQFMGGRYS